MKDSQRSTLIPTVKFNAKGSKKSANLSELSSKVDLIKLETHLDALAGFPSYMVHLDQNRIFIKSEKKILIFDRDGSYLTQVNSKGPGPKEYNSITDVFVNSIKEEIFIVDQKKVQVYDFDGEFVKSIPIPFQIGGAFRDSDGKIYLPHSQNYAEKKRRMLSILDEHFEVIRTFDSKVSESANDTKQNLFFAGNPYKMGEGLFYKEPFNDTIYQVSTDKFIPAWVIDKDGYGFEIEEGVKSENWQRAARKGKIPPLAIFGTEDYFFLSFHNNDGKCFGLFDKDEMSFKYYNLYRQENLTEDDDFGIVDDVFSNSVLKFWPNYSNGSNIVAEYVFPSDLNDGQIESLGLSYDDNPIILLVDLNK